MRVRPTQSSRPSPPNGVVVRPPWFAATVVFAITALRAPLSSPWHRPGALCPRPSALDDASLRMPRPICKPRSRCPRTPASRKRYGWGASRSPLALSPDSTKPCLVWLRATCVWPHPGRGRRGLEHAPTSSQPPRNHGAVPTDWSQRRRAPILPSTRNRLRLNRTGSA